MKHADPVRRLEVALEFKRLSLPQKRHPALQNLWPSSVRPFLLDFVELFHGEASGVVGYRTVVVARKGGYSVYEQSCCETHAIVKNIGGIVEANRHAMKQALFLTCSVY